MLSLVFQSSFFQANVKYDQKHTWDTLLSQSTILQRASDSPPYSAVKLQQVCMHVALECVVDGGGLRTCPMSTVVALVQCTLPLSHTHTHEGMQDSVCLTPDFPRIIDNIYLC